MMSVLHYDSPRHTGLCTGLGKDARTGPFSHLPRSSYRLALGSFTDDFRNRISIVGLPDERAFQDNVNMDDPYGNPHPLAAGDESNFVLLADALHGYPVTKIAWEPASTFREPWKDHSTELLTSTGDALRIWEFSQVEEKPNLYVGRHAGGTTGKLAQKIALSSSKNPNPTTAPLTSFSWNTVSPNLVVTSSIDTTCTVWDLSASTAVTQLIAHDREVYDVAWAQAPLIPSYPLAPTAPYAHSTSAASNTQQSWRGNGSGNVAASAVAPPGGTASLLRIAFNPLDANFLATFHSDSPDVQILDMRSPGRPVVELKGHRGAITSIGWALKRVRRSRQPGTTANFSYGTSVRDTLPRAHLPLLAYTAQSEINNIAWSPPIVGGEATRYRDGGGAAHGEWIAYAAGRTVKALKV
ncbi:hypothetical protein BS47DRAFT_1390355 [Hydnum rufescens UP504]|uniref:Uncharacterized protein n=1 Tax=Hydnum rufescens UP504 TaxID=1448309 RepID=A0A9P6B3L9_9AGAM|nr:hypothetical protein BS47DRAFT_1390355 [Hydnum rufescens UP504]